MLLWRHLTRFVKKGSQKAGSHSGEVKQTVYTQGSSKFFKMNRLWLTVVLLFGILGSFAFSKKPDPLANKKKVSWVTKTGSVRSHCLRSWLRSTCSSRRGKSCWSALDRRWSNRTATNDVVVDDFRILFQNNEKIHWRGFLCRDHGPGGGYFRNFWVEMCRWEPGTLNLYQS